MLHRITNQFLDYCRLAEFSVRSIQTLTARINEFEAFLKFLKIRSITRITYRHLIDFVADYESPSIHVRKSRVWILRQFFHFLTLYQHVPKNIALKLPYPKIKKTGPRFLTTKEFKLLIRHFSDQADSPLNVFCAVYNGVAKNNHIIQTVESVIYILMDVPEGPRTQKTFVKVIPTNAVSIPSLVRSSSERFVVSRLGFILMAGSQSLLWSGHLPNWKCPDVKR